MSKKIEIGKFVYKTKTYTAFIEETTEILWIKDEKGYMTNFNNTKAKPENALEKAYEMLKTSGQ